jgi:hypothetical protein
MNTLAFQRENRILKESTNTAEFWAVAIDGETIATDAKPFDAATDEIVLSECDYCYFCGMPEISVRRTNDEHVIWFVDLDSDQSPTIPRNRVFEFDLNLYQKQLGGDASELPYLSLHEFERVITAMDFPREEDALYTIPELPNDSLGKHTLRQICSALADGRIEMRLDTPNNIKSLTIGLDLERIPESRISIGDTGSGTVFRFEQWPAFPIWLAIRDEPKPFLKFHSDSEIAE